MIPTRGIRSWFQRVPVSIWFWGVMVVYSAVFLFYAETRAFTWDENYHLLAAQLIARGKVPYIDFCFPQTPLNAYWNALWMRIGGDSWQAPHFWAALFTIAAVALASTYVLRRFPVADWRMAAALTVAMSFGLNCLVVSFGPIGQAYGICLLGLAAALRLALRAVERKGPLWTFGVGLFAGVAAGSSLLTAAAAPVLLVWILYYNRAGSRWAKFLAFAAGVLIPFAPAFWLFALGPRQAWFNLVQYHALFRTLSWPHTTQHDLEIVTQWIDSGQALMLLALSAFGLIYVAKRSQWPAVVKAEFYLCAWLAAAISLEVSRAHPTFSRYFVLATPFAAILAVVGLYWMASSMFDPARPWRPALVLIALMALGLGKYLYDDREINDFRDHAKVAAKVDEVTPRDALLYADDPVYFLTKRTPPPGLELHYSHVIDLGPETNALLHILPEAQVKRMVRSGMFATAVSCDDDQIADYGLVEMYQKRADVGECAVFWDRKK